MITKKLIATLAAAGVVAAAATPASANPAAATTPATPTSSASLSAECIPIAVEKRDARGYIYYVYDYVCF
jgi:hypothetical protein